MNYLRKCGSVFHLYKMLGHSTFEKTKRYANLLTEDLQQIHEKVNLLIGSLEEDKKKRDDTWGEPSLLFMICSSVRMNQA